MTPAVFDKFENAMTAGDRLEAWSATGELMAWLADLRNRPDAKTIKSIVWTAAKRRSFEMAELLAASAAGRFDAEPATRRLHSQMLMERGLTEEALPRIRTLLSNPRLSRYDKIEAEGHIGRIYKDRFLAAVAARDEKNGRAALEKSLEAYLTSYELDNQCVWHGINAVALLSRPEAAAVWPDATAKAAGISRRIVIDAQANPDEYTAATLAEAHIAFRDFASALEQIRFYTSDRKVNPFQLATFHKQLTRVWMLDREPSPGPELVAMVSATLLERESGSFNLSGGDVKRDVQTPSSRLERVFGVDRFDSVKNYKLGLERCMYVAKIGASDARGDGTGFILRGSDICPAYGDGTVLVTNAHVLADTKELLDSGSLHPGDALVTFEALPGAEGKILRPGAMLFSSPPRELDVTIVELFDVPVPESGYPLANALPGRDTAAQIRVIGHPSGGGLSFSVNQLLDHDNPKIHYRTATEGGSSGSPVFNSQWSLIGLHHEGGEAMPKLRGQPGTYQANEGLWIQAIRAGATGAAAARTSA